MSFESEYVNLINKTILGEAQSLRRDRNESVILAKVFRFGCHLLKMRLTLTPQPEIGLTL